MNTLQEPPAKSTEPIPATGPAVEDPRQVVSQVIFSPQRAILSCDNVWELESPAREKAAELTHRMGEALEREQVDLFNELKSELTGLFKRNGKPITQWNLLRLRLSRPLMLQNADLSHINLAMTALSGENQTLSLDGANLQGGVFLCADFRQASMEAVNLEGADLRFADLEEVNLEQTVLTGADLSNAKLSGANLRRANLYFSKLNAVIARQACLAEANLRRTDLRHSDLYGADLTKARLQEADLREASLFMANLSEAWVRKADLKKAQLIFARLVKARMRGACLQEANLTSADLEDADLSHAGLQSALLNRSRLARASFKKANLQGADFSEALGWEDAYLEAASYDKLTGLPDGFQPGKRKMVNLDSWFSRLLLPVVTFRTARFAR